MLLGHNQPGFMVGAGLGLMSVAVVTMLIYPLKGVAPSRSLSVAHLLAVLVVSRTGGRFSGC